MTITFDELANHEDNDDGYCTSCGDFTECGGVEPDGRGRECPDCGNHTVMGAQEAVLIGLVDLED